ncbi:hypothetical protein FHP25_28285 [Vineibacter terrae]|uniref:DUF4407 domain-containing protein n=1 Tax=Vineibacter terrae TaxID=2586908 RepID=A0A5C8PDA1_9HYPH|nr:hypothetical protein [Vineibacter terrae]TXL71772.1 hypothetical protein FHP25_28285 [Vineibacter terrae]
MMQRLQLVVLVACAIAASVATFFGTRALVSHGVESVVVPFVTASVVGIGLGSIWHLLLGAVPKAQGTGTKAALSVLAGVLFLVAAAVSAWFVATAISGNTAVRTHMGEQIAQYRTALATAHSNVLVEQNVLAELTGSAAAFRSMADAEQQSGRLSGTKGEGAVVDRLRRVADVYDGLAREGRAVRDQADQFQHAGALALRQMDEIVSVAETSAVAQKRFAEAVGELQQAITQLQALSILPGIRRAGVVDVSATGLNPGQRRAMDNLQAELRQHAERLGQSVDALQRQKRPVQVISYRPMGPGEAVLEYGDRVVAGWAVGIGIDVLPLLLFVLLLISANDRLAQVQATESDNRRLQVVGND